MSLRTGSRPTGPDVYSAVDSAAALSGWQNGIIADLQNRSDVAWYLFILVPEPADSDTRQRIILRLKTLPPFTLPRVPIWRNRAATVTFVVILLGIPVGEYRTARPSDYIGTSQLDRWSPRCSPVHSPHRPTRHRPTPWPQSENSLPGWPSPRVSSLRKVRSLIPWCGYSFANAGRGTTHGVRVAGMLGELARLDRSIVAAIGFNESRQTTIAMIRALGAVGLPVVAATLSADELAENHQMYLQVCSTESTAGGGSGRVRGPASRLRSAAYWTPTRIERTDLLLR